MEYDYKYGNNFYKYYGNKGIKSTIYNILAPKQQQNTQPGMEYLMKQLPVFDNPKYKGSNKLKGKDAIITGGDSGLGRACSIAYVKEGAKVVIVYLNEDKDTHDTKNYIDSMKEECILIRGDITNHNFCKDVVRKTLDKFGKIDILINNAGV